MTKHSHQINTAAKDCKMPHNTDEPPEAVMKKLSIGSNGARPDCDAESDKNVQNDPKTLAVVPPGCDAELIKALKKALEDIGQKMSIGSNVAQGEAELEEAVKKAWVDFSKMSNSLPTARLDRDAKFDKVAKQVFDKFTQSERAFLLGLSAAEQAAILGLPSCPDWFAVAHFRLHIQILLTLKGVKPCVLTFRTGADLAITDRLIKTCLLPLMEEYNLEAYGFTLRKIKHPVPTDVHEGFENSWVFADMRSEHWKLVEYLFFVPHPGQKQLELNVAKAMGYPVSNTEYDGTIMFKDETERDELRHATGKDICCISVAAYFAPGETLEDRVAVMEHFKKCARAAQSVGHELVIGSYDYPGLVDTELGLA